MPQTADEGCRFPVTVWDCGNAALSARRAAAASRHIGRRPCFVNENESLGIKPQLTFPPQAAGHLHVRSLLLAGVQGFF